MKRPHLDEIHTSFIQAALPQIFTYFLLVWESKPSIRLEKKSYLPPPKASKVINKSNLKNGKYFT